MWGTGGYHGSSEAEVSWLLRLSWQSLLGEIRRVLEQAGATGCQGSRSSLGPDRPFEVLLRVKEWHPQPTGVTCVLCSALFSFASFLILDFSQFIDLTFVCDAEPQKANSMAFSRTDVVCLNCKQTPQQSVNRIVQSTALRGHVPGSECVDGQSLGLAVKESSVSLAGPNRPEWSLCERPMHLRVAPHFLTHDWLPS